MRKKTQVSRYVYGNESGRNLRLFLAYECCLVQSPVLTLLSKLIHIICLGFCCKINFKRVKNCKQVSTPKTK